MARIVVEARRSAGLSDSRFKPGPRRADPDQVDDHTAALEQLEDVAISLTMAGLHGLADRTRDAARRLT